MQMIFQQGKPTSAHP